MSRYSDLIADPRYAEVLQQLTLLPPDRVADLKREHPGLPDGYADFLATVGHGTIGKGAYKIYSGLVAPEDVYGHSLSELGNLVLFGDDFCGTCGALDADTWNVLEVDERGDEADD